MTSSQATTGGLNRNRRPLRNATRSRLYAFALLAPAIVVVLLVIIYPLIMAAQMSLYEVRIFRVDRGLTGNIGLHNYRDMFDNPSFWQSLRVTLYYVIFGVIGSFGIGLFTAVLLNRPFKGRALARVLMVLPWPIPGVVAATIFVWMFNSSFGVLNYLLLKTGLVSQPVQWFTQTVPALIAVTAATIWKGYPFFTISLLAGMQSVPKELYEAARVDGASAVQQFRWITIPALAPVIGISLVIATLWQFRVFDIIFVMTGGGPSGGTETLAIQIYREAFQYFEMSYAAAVGMITLALSIISTFFYLRMTSRSFY
ncbi:MAG: sugar ABC transporter permease [Trueperaceae bacterium]|nr:sugar ABC transporter permease [Trueperaceae bacterium]